MQRAFASSEAAAAPRRGAGLFQRITSFLVGAGLTGVVTQFYLVKEIHEGNKAMIDKQKDLEKRIAKLEKK